MNKSEWIDQAYFAATKALRYTKHPFLSEDLLKKVLAYVDEPADKRAFGHVIRRLHADKLIYHHGYGSAKTSNRAAKPQWAKVKYKPAALYYPDWD